MAARTHVNYLLGHLPVHVRAAINCLRQRPTMYRLGVDGRIVLPEKNGDHAFFARVGIKAGGSING